MQVPIDTVFMPMDAETHEGKNNEYSLIEVEYKYMTIIQITCFTNRTTFAIVYKMGAPVRKKFLSYTPQFLQTTNFKLSYFWFEFS